MSTFAAPLSHRPDSAEARQVGLDDRVPPLKRTPDGMIDYDFYIRKSHRMRSEAAHSLLKSAWRALRPRFGGARQSSRPSRGKIAHAA